MLKKLYLKYEEAIKYIFFGGCTTLVYYIARFGSRLLMGDFDKGAVTATVIAQITAITFAFITNKVFVFKSRTETAGQLVREAVAFYAGRGVTFLLDILITYVFVVKFSGFFIDILSLDSINYEGGLFPKFGLLRNLAGSPEKMNEFIWTMLSQVMILILNYFFSKLFVFRKKKETEEVN